MAPIRTLAAVLLGLAIAGPAWAQDETPQDRPRDRAANRTQDREPRRDAARGPGARRMLSGLDRGELREKLEGHLSELDTFRGNIAGAIAKLDAGEPIEDVLAEMPRLNEWIRRAASARGPMAGGPEGLLGAGGDRPKPGSPERAEPIGPERQKELREFVGERFPRLHERFAALRDANPEVADRMFARIAPRVDEIQKLWRNDPDAAELKISEMQSGLDVLGARRTLMEAMRSEDAGDDQAAKAAMVRAIGKHFDAKIALREHEITKLEKQIERLRGDIAEHRKRRDDAVNLKAEELVRGMRGERRGPGEGAGRPDRDREQRGPRERGDRRGPDRP